MLQWLYRLAFWAILKTRLLFFLTPSLQTHSYPYTSRLTPGSSAAEVRGAATCTQRYQDVQLKPPLELSEQQRQSQCLCQFSKDTHRVHRFRGFTSFTANGLTAWKTASLISTSRAHSTVSGSYFPSNEQGGDTNTMGAVWNVPHHLWTANTSVDECITLRNRSEPQGLHNQEIDCTSIICWKYIE